MTYNTTIVIQEKTRKKYQKIRCPYCNSTSRIIKDFYNGCQTRRCKQGHIFNYDYGVQAISQKKNNWKHNRWA